MCIIEAGKQRLIASLCFFERYFRPATFLHCYSNIDNLIIALTVPSFEEAVEPELREHFEQEKKKYLQSFHSVIFIRST